MKAFPALLLAAAMLAGCTTITKVEGQQSVGDRLVLQVDSAWNRVAPPGSRQPFVTWTQEGLFLDELRMWGGIRPGGALVEVAPAKATGDKPPRVPRFDAGMSPDQLVTLFERAYAVDGSMVEMGRVEPVEFAGGPGLRFEFSVVRKVDDVQLQGMGWVRVQGGELYALCFVAPRLSFYGRLAPKAQALAASARIR